METLERILENPPKEYRAVPFWSWNDKLEKEELRRQIQEMKDKGIGGFFMHARGGLRTEYMGGEWMDCIRVSAEEAKKLDMHAWLYDEEGWPSGFAGGKVTSLGEYYHMRWMEEEKTGKDKIDWKQSILGVYSEEGEFLGKSQEELECRENRDVYVVCEKRNPYYVDVLNPEVIKKFIEVTHEVYYGEFEGSLGNTIPGFFTDEPQFAKFEIPYSVCLPERFEKENGYPAEQCYTALFREVKNFRKYRYDFWKTVSRMYTEGFCKTIYDWCSEHHCYLTGHLMREDSLLMQMQATAGVMPSYEYMDMPGIDWLRRRISSPLTPKQAGSVAAQLGKKFVISEMYAMTGWDCTPEELKWIAQWQYVNGVNKMCQHLEAYTVRGIRKRDYPPSLFYQQSWWEEYRQFNDYFSRLGVILTRGGSGAEVLLVHPMRSGWILYDGKEDGRIAGFGKKFEELSQYLSDVHIEHHYGDEEIMRRHGSVENGGIRIGKCTYKTVILPDMLTIEKSTAELLICFAEAGGKIYGLGEFPQYITGENSVRLLDVLRTYVTDLKKEEVKPLVSGQQTFPVSITENGNETAGVHYQLRVDGEKRYLYIVNLNKNESTMNVVKVRGTWKADLYDPLNNEKKACSVTLTGEETCVNVPLSEMEGAVLFLEPGRREDEALKQKDDPAYLSAGGRWDIVRTDLNSMTLDYCSYRIDGGIWQEKIPTIRLMDILLKEKKPVHVSLRFDFDMRVQPENLNEIYLVAEVPEILNADINGESVTLTEQGWWKDKSFRKYDIRNYLRKGKNEIILEIEFVQRQKVYDVLFGENVLETELNKLTYDTEIESVYLLGDFAVYNGNGWKYSWRKELICDESFYIDQQPGYVYGDDITSQGFCFFAGVMKLGQQITLHEYDDSKGVKLEKNTKKRYIYRFGRPYAMCAKLYVNGKKVKDVLWAPYECDITDYVHTGDNRIEWEIYASNRNLLGPHHHVDGELYAVFPADFTDTPSVFKADKRNIWSDEYHLVKFGLQGGII